MQKFRLRQQLRDGHLDNELRERLTTVCFGFIAPPDPADVAAMEDLPIDSLWVGGHVASPNPSPEAMVALARLSAATHRVIIGTSVLLLPLYEPAIIAKQVADIDAATGGRVVLGVGIGGEYPAEFPRLPRSAS